jgi:hypothetical protein
LYNYVHQQINGILKLITGHKSITQQSILYGVLVTSHCAYDLLERRLHNLNEKDYSEVQTLVQVGNRLVYISFFYTCLIIIPQRSQKVPK